MVALGLGAAAMIYLARSDAIAQAERNAAIHATLVADTLLQTGVRPADFKPGVPPSRLDALDRLFTRDVLSDETIRVQSCYAPTGVVTYSTNRRQIGTAPEPEESPVLGGDTVTGVTDLSGEGGGGPSVKALEVYEAVHDPAGSRPLGVVELYKDYEPSRRRHVRHGCAQRSCS